MAEKIYKFNEHSFKFELAENNPKETVIIQITDPFEDNKIPPVEDSCPLVYNNIEDVFKELNKKNAPLRSDFKEWLEGDRTIIIRKIKVV